MRLARVLLTVTAVLLAAACASASEKVGTARSSTAPATTALSPGSSTTLTGGTGATGATGPGPPFATTRTSVPASAGPALLSTVRAAHQEGFDRLVFEFTDRVPGYEVSYVGRPVLEDASGREVAIEGAAVLRVKMVTASGVDLSTSGARTTYTGPDRLRPSGTTVVRELARSGDFEGTLTWVAGASVQAPFRVTTLSSPPRLVVDVRAT
jgi:hypothetical protein